MMEKKELLCDNHQGERLLGIEADYMHYFN